MDLCEQGWFSTIRRPSRYLGGEINIKHKDPSKVAITVGLVFPDVYEVGMSHLGLKIIYHLLNRREWISAERAFSPWPDMEEALRAKQIGLQTWESGRNLADFDIIGFSIQHELCYTNILNVLDLCGLPFYSRERNGVCPLIIAGGPGCFNPEPVADFFDAMVIGDGEDATLEICRALRVMKQEKIVRKKEILNRLRRIDGVYIPSFFSIHYEKKGTISNVSSEFEDYKNVRKAITSRLDAFPFPEAQIVPFTELVHDRAVVEISRGCTRGCRFCQAGMIYRPVRERSPDAIIQIAENTLVKTGYEDFSLLSLSTGDYSQIGGLLQRLMDRFQSERTGISLPSLRVDTLNTKMIEQVKRVRKTGFTIAPEAGSDRLRRVINKGLTESEILETARLVYQAGWNLVKLYFMIGLPFETDADLQGIIKLALQISKLSPRKGKRPNVNVSLSTFVPKSHTPFMWMPQISLEESLRRIHLVQDGLRGSRVRVKWNQPELSWLEGIMARGDRNLSQSIVHAWRLGARFDAWGEHFNMDLWHRAFADTKIEPAFYQRRRAFDEILPWDHIESGVSRGFLKKECERGAKEQFTPDCREKCLECGVCDHKRIDPVLFNHYADSKIKTQNFDSDPIVSQRFRMTFTKLNRARYLSHLELSHVLIRAFRRAKLRLAYSQGFHPMPKISFFSALPVGTGSQSEMVDVELTEVIRESDLLDRVNRQLPNGINLLEVRKISASEKKLRLKACCYRVTLKDGQFEISRLHKFISSNHFEVVKKNKKGEHTIDARHLVTDMALLSPNQIEMTIRETEKSGLKPVEIAAAVFQLAPENIQTMDILKTKQYYA